MIVATMFGGPRDGLVVAHNALTPLVFPITSSPVWDGVSPQEEDLRTYPTSSTVTYVPRRDTLQVCRCMPHWAHPVSMERSVDLTAITYATHHVCTYYVAGWGR